MLQYVAEYSIALQGVEIVCNVLQFAAVCCSDTQKAADREQCVAGCCKVLQCVAVCCSVLQRVAVIAVCCSDSSVLQ